MVLHWETKHCSRVCGDRRVHTADPETLQIGCQIHHDAICIQVQSCGAWIHPCRSKAHTIQNDWVACYIHESGAVPQQRDVGQGRVYRCCVWRWQWCIWPEGPCDHWANCLQSRTACDISCTVNGANQNLFLLKHAYNPYIDCMLAVAWFAR